MKKFIYYNVKFYTVIKVGKKGKSSMDSKAAARIQSAADKSGKNQDFKARAQRAAAKNKK